MEENQYINFEEGRKFLANDHLVFLKRFYEVDLDVSINNVQASFSKKDWIELKRSAHSLKGTSSYIGALTCRKLSENLQLACSESAISEEKINAYTKALLDHLAKLKKYLRDYFNSSDNASSQVKVIELPTAFEEFKESSPSLVVKKLIPPVSRITLIENNQSYEEEEVDAYDELNKQWRCILT